MPTPRFLRSASINRRALLAGMAMASVGHAVAPRRSIAQQAASSPESGGTLPQGVAHWTKYNLNTMSDEQILAIPGTGDRMIREFAEYRPYTTIGQFRAEIGKYVDEEVVASYERYVFVPVDPSNPDADTLQQLPGIDEDEAAQLADGGPYADDAAFLTALGELVSSEQAQLAPAFLASSDATEATWFKYNLNTITTEQAISIPGAGEQMAHEFEEYRPWSTIGQFRAEIGKYVDDDIVAAYERYVFVPIVPSDADEATFQQLPGVDEEIAKALVDNQPYADTGAFLTALGEHVTAAQAEMADTFLATS